uniref:Uncharacterized protein n=1 Tax=Cacopsylla melanoneura TaxID=428564 RepID=A0A8D8R9X1_9HEMI
MVRTRSQRGLVIESTPGVEDQGTSGTTAGSDSIRTGGDRVTRNETRQSTVGSPELSQTACTISSPDTPTVATPARTVSQRANPILPETTLAGRRRVRMAWTPEVNTFIMRTFYHLTKLETDMTAYQDKLHRTFIAQYPQINVNKGRVADQRRTIVRNNLLSPETLEMIKNDVQNILTQENNERTPNTSVTSEGTRVATDGNSVDEFIGIPTVEPTTSTDPDSTFDTSEPSQDNRNNLPDEDLQTLTLLKDTLNNTLAKYSGMDPTKRPYIPKQSTSKKLARNLVLMNTHILPLMGQDIQTFSELHDLIYCTAFTVSICNGAKIREDQSLADSSNRTRTEPIPPWKQRLIRKVEIKRAEIARLKEYINGNRGNKVQKKVREIFEKYKIHTPRDAPNYVPQEFMDTLQQRLRSLSTRLKRYNKSTNKHKQNNLFLTNQKKFYKNIRGTQQMTSESTDILPTKEQITTYWSEL